jgi:hypothetical protein
MMLLFSALLSAAPVALAQETAPAAAGTGQTIRHLVLAALGGAAVTLLYLFAGRLTGRWPRSSRHV